MGFRSSYGWTRIEEPGEVGEDLYIENPQEQEILRDIHRMRKDYGWSYAGIAASMTAKGADKAPRPFGGRWTELVVQRMFERCKPGERPPTALKKRKREEKKILWYPGMTIKQVTEEYRRVQAEQL